MDLSARMQCFFVLIQERTVVDLVRKKGNNIRLPKVQSLFLRFAGIDEFLMMKGKKDDDTFCTTFLLKNLGNSNTNFAFPNNFSF